MIESKHVNQFRNAIDNIYPLGPECRTELESILYYRKLSKHEYFSKEDQFTKESGFINNGVMRMFYLSENGEEWNKHFFIENDFVAASMDPEKKSITYIQALTQVTLLCIPYPQFAELCKKFHQLAIFLQKVTFNYLEQKQKKEIRFLSNQTIDNYKFFVKKYPGLENIIPHYHIASYLGITPTQLSRIRKKVKTRFHQHM